MTRFAVASSFEFLVDEAETLVVTDVSLSYGPNRSIHIHAYIDFDSHQTIREKKAFHLSDSVIEPNMASFITSRPIEFEARLSSEHVFLLAPEMPVALSARRLFRSEMGSPLRKTQSWYMLNVKQQIFPKLKAGYQTTWTKNHNT